MLLYLYNNKGICLLIRTGMLKHDGTTVLLLLVFECHMEYGRISISLLATYLFTHKIKLLNNKKTYADRIN